MLWAALNQSTTRFNLALSWTEGTCPSPWLRKENQLNCEQVPFVEVLVAGGVSCKAPGQDELLRCQ